METKSQQIANNIINIFANLKEQRQAIEGIWADINKYVKPQKNYFLNTSSYNASNSIYDSSAPLASDHLASFIWSLVNSSSLRWFNFSLKGKNPTKEQNKWSDNVSTIIANALLSPEVGFYHKSFELYSDLVNYGTGVFYSSYDFKNKTMLLKNVALKDCYIIKSELSNKAGLIRKITLSKQEFLKFFKHKAEYINSNEENVNILHAVIRADLIKDTKNILLNKAWSSFYILEHNGFVLSHKAYSSCPYTVLNWGASLELPYSESPAILALADIKTLNEIAKSIIIATQRQANPPILIAKESSIKGAKIAPGSLIKGGLNSSTGQSLIKALSLDGAKTRKHT